MGPESWTLFMETSVRRDGCTAKLCRFHMVQPLQGCSFMSKGCYDGMQGQIPPPLRLACTLCWGQCAGFSAHSHLHFQRMADLPNVQTLFLIDSFSEISMPHLRCRLTFSSRHADVCRKKMLTRCCLRLSFSGDSLHLIVQFGCR